MKYLDAVASAACRLVEVVFTIAGILILAVVVWPLLLALILLAPYLIRKLVRSVGASPTFVAPPPAPGHRPPDTNI